MENLPKKELLSEKDKEFCITAGSIGLAISFTCLIQYFYLFPSLVWQVILFSIQFIFSIIAFVLLIKKHPAATLFVIIATTLVFIYFGVLIYLFFNGVIIFSVMLLILFFYLVVITVLMYIRGLPAKLRLSHREKKAELEFWDGKI